MKMKVLRPNFEKRGGLVTVVTQDVSSSEILMVASTNLEGYLETLRTGKAVYFSTSRNERWMKGETSGHTQRVHNVLIDCDGDAIIYEVSQQGGACHTGAYSCFFRTFSGGTTPSSIVKPGETLSLSDKDKLPEIEAEVMLGVLPM